MSTDYHTLPHTSSELKRSVNISWHTIWRHLLVALNCNDCPTTYRITIIVVKVKVLTQHHSDSLLSTIKALPSITQVGTSKLFDSLSSKKGPNSPVFDLSFEGAYPDTLSEHPLYKERAYSVSCSWVEALYGIVQGGFDSNWSHINIGTVCGKV